MSTSLQPLTHVPHFMSATCSSLTQVKRVAGSFTFELLTIRCRFSQANIVLRNRARVVARVVVVVARGAGVIGGLDDSPETGVLVIGFVESVNFVEFVRLMDGS